ncbi:MAG: hypothetical protein M3Q29_09235 [Chloroflexota bacterium]|nr:hypothetical protein [Chloroflexota bacterium]
MGATLAQAVAAALLVLVVPGYCWARTLFPSLDWVEKVTVTIALSLFLVPTAALLIARVFGTGITLPVAMAAVITVTVVGFLLQLRTGSAPVHRLSELKLPPLRSAAVVPLSVAAILILIVSLQRLPMRPWAGYIAPFILATGILYLGENVLRARRSHCAKPDAMHVPPSAADYGRAPSVEQPRWTSAILSYRALLSAVLLLTLVRGYLGPVRHDWPFIRGYDLYAHAVMTNLMITEGSNKSYQVYPPGFHTLSAVMVQLSGLETLDLYAALAPELALLPALSCYTFGRRLLGPAYGLASALFAGVLLNTTGLLMHYATWVDIIVAGFLLVLTLMSLVMLLNNPSVRNVVLFVFLGASIVLWHTISTFYLVLLLGLVSVLALPYLLWRDRTRGAALLLALALLSFVSVFYAWDTYDLPRTVGALLGRSEATAAASQIGAVAGRYKPRDVMTLPRYLSQPIVWFGMLALLLLPAGIRRMSFAQLTAILLLVAWSLAFWIGSRTSFFASRFARDLGVPLCLLAGTTLVTVLRSLPRSLSSISWDRAAPTVAVLFLTLVVAQDAQRSLVAASKRDPSLIIDSNIAAAGKWLKAHNEGGRIIAHARKVQDTSAMMLALSGYSGMLAIPVQQQINFPRLVPPRPLEEVKEVARVTSHPHDSRTREMVPPKTGG